MQAAREVLRNTQGLLLQYNSHEPVKFCAALHHALDIGAVWAWRSNTLGDECLEAVLQLASAMQGQGQLAEVHPCAHLWSPETQAAVCVWRVRALPHRPAQPASPLCLERRLELGMALRLLKAAL